MKAVDRTKDSYCYLYFQPKFVTDSGELIIKKNQFARIYKIDPLPPKNQKDEEQFGFGMWFWEHKFIFHGQCAIDGRIIL